MEKGDYKNSTKYYRKGLEILKTYPDDNDLNAVKSDAEKAVVYIKGMEGKN